MAEHLTFNQRVRGSNPLRVTILCRCSSMVELQPSKLTTWVRFPSPAPTYEQVNLRIDFFLFKKRMLPCVTKNKYSVFQINWSNFFKIFFSRVYIFDDKYFSFLLLRITKNTRLTVLKKHNL